MGNVACSPEHMVCETMADDRTHRTAAFDKHHNEQQTPINQFLTVHIEDRPEKSIIEQHDVVDALVQQAMELIRRDHQDAEVSLFSNSSDGRSQHEDEEDIDDAYEESSYDSDTSASRNSLLVLQQSASFEMESKTGRSEVTMGGRSSVYGGMASSEHNFSAVTAVTTNTVETRVIRNQYNSRQSDRQKQQHQALRPLTSSSPHSRKTLAGEEESSSLLALPPRLLGKGGFHAKAQMQSDLQRAITKSSARNKNDPRMRLYEMVKSLQAGSDGCNLVPQGLLLLPDPIPAYLGEQVREHMTILHLRLKPRFTEYFQSHLSRLLPDSPFTQTVSKGISLSRLSPPRRPKTPPQPQGPALERTFSDSTTSTAPAAVDMVDFGEGPPSKPVRLVATGGAFADLGITGSLGLVERREQQQQPHYGDSHYFPDRIKPPSHYIVLLNRRSGVPLAVCALKAVTTGPPVVRIYVTKRRMFGQRPAASTRKLGLDWAESYPLYPWAEIVTEGRYPNHVVRYSIYMAKGNDGRFEETPSYKAEHSSVGSPEIRIVGRTEREHKYTGCAVLSLCREEGVVKEDDLFLSLSVSKGIDPAILICFAAFVDEAMERTMRQQCQAVSETIYRRS